MWNFGGMSGDVEGNAPAPPAPDSLWEVRTVEGTQHPLLPQPPGSLWATGLKRRKTGEGESHGESGVMDA